jgi:ATP-binding cassette subfamily A (ABC1) protein 3
MRFQLGASGNLQISGVFEKVEAEKHSLGIDDYAISQTSLEQIFNGFASQQVRTVRASRRRM